MKRRISPPHGFTLIEVLISLALLMLIMVGVSTVFFSVRQSVATGTALAEATRASRAAHSVLYDDLKAALTEEDPFFVIASQRQSMFLNERDLATDADKDPNTVDLDADGFYASVNEQLTDLPLSPSYRNCRTDVLSFFVRDLRRKQTGSNTQIVSPMGARDVYVWYGHLAESDSPTSSVYHMPGTGDPVSNPVNYFSSNWTLGRMVMLLSDVTIDQTNQRQVAIDRTATGSPLPLSKDSWASLEPDPNFRPIQSARNDLVQAKTSDMTTSLKQHIALQPTANWWSALVYRFNSVPAPKSPLTGASAALSAPAFLPDCRSFAVEYAGDFVTQLQDVRGVSSLVPDGKITIEDMLDPMYGQVTRAAPDGVIDFYTVATGATGPLGAERIERVRFYGLPRDADQTGVVSGIASRTIDLGAVVPLRDMVRSGASMNPALANYVAPFERSITFAPAANYMAPRAFRPNDNYVCVWGPGQTRPKLLRIVLTLEDGNDRLGVGQTYEYVFEVGR